MQARTGTQADKQSFDGAEEVRSFDRGRLEIVNVGGHPIGRATFEPGWQWSKSVKPIAQTDLCEAEHLGYFISGRMRVKMADGSETEYGPGDAMHLPPGHDAWIVGSEPCVVVDFVGFQNYAKKRPARRPGRRMQAPGRFRGLSFHPGHPVLHPEPGTVHINEY